jgi:hypothetical protein
MARYTNMYTTMFIPSERNEIAMLLKDAIIRFERVLFRYPFSAPRLFGIFSSNYISNDY